MKKALLAAALALAIIVAAFVLLLREPIAPLPLASAKPASIVSEIAPPISPPREPSAPSATPTPAAPATPDPRQTGSPLAAELNAPNSDAAHDVAALHGMLRQYLRLLHQRQGHPIGNDSDLARVLTGHNPMHLVVLPPNHPAISPDGRLRDRWGTPYFIHPRGNGAFEIRSDGPDRKLFTADDVIANPPPSRTEPADAALLGDAPAPEQ